MTSPPVFLPGLLAVGSRRVILPRRHSKLGGPSMKITVDVDCTPDEARAFFGLPDVKPMQDQLLQEVQQRLSANISAMDPQTMIRTWLPATLEGFEQLQRAF